jgi:hypothetical protein
MPYIRWLAHYSTNFFWTKCLHWSIFLLEITSFELRRVCAVRVRADLPLLIALGNGRKPFQLAEILGCVQYSYVKI